MTIYIPIGMRTKTPTDGLVVNTCAHNGSADLGDLTSWDWANPTNTAITHPYAGIQAVSTEALWQGTKIFDPDGRPDPAALAGDWRRGKKRRPIGAWAGEGQPLITNPGNARRAIYIPAYERQMAYWAERGADEILAEAELHHRVYLRDFDTGRGVDRNGPMSHAWLLSVYLNARKGQP